MIASLPEAQRVLKRIVNQSSLAKIVTSPVQEKDILYLQNLFMTPGIHVLPVDNFGNGRALVQELLASLKWYRTIGYISTTNKGSLPHATNLLTRISEPVTTENLGDFFIEEFDYDFLWVEATNDLFDKPWMGLFEQQLLDLRINEMIPVILLTLAL